MKYEGKYFLLGAIFGAIFTIFWDFFLNHNHTIDDLRNTSKIEEIKQDSEERLLSYIEGEWVSSIGDVIVKLNINKTQDFIIVEVINDKKLQKNFKIVRINKVNGLFGIITFDICDTTKTCTEENLIPIQFNKVFGMDKTITISYDSRLTYCIDADDMCTRAFKRVN